MTESLCLLLRTSVVIGATHLLRDARLFTVVVVVTAAVVVIRSTTIGCKSAAGPRLAVRHVCFSR